MDTVEQVKGYFYKGYWNLKPDELWALILIDAMSQHLEIGVTAAAGIIAGYPILPTPSKPAGATKGTSIASILSRKMLPNARLPLGMQIPTITGRISSMRISRTNKIGAIIGRYVPWIGYGAAIWYAQAILRDTSQVFNSIVAPKDRIQWTYF
ncbi:cytoplasmic protein [Chania multitudinisentens RB-25]|uniref:Cytoplasmic protein n=1 Tax=Chania multitudinisentens RB-25 TaxID=1441930 RepID=W0LEN5_9GAMM|nr:hypothetical protein [Chania multitudinisentens]AHG22206.1 cytoplasmic protein [Chania multitudinisentens RB-25]